MELNTELLSQTCLTY
uniref:Uncharacterized protein n=1 Tax=Arundo donax TaxID=35708 RepID=A0A0A9HR20_ARUDO